MKKKIKGILCLFGSVGFGFICAMGIALAIIYPIGTVGKEGISGNMVNVLVCFAISAVLIAVGWYGADHFLKRLAAKTWKEDLKC